MRIQPKDEYREAIDRAMEAMAVGRGNAFSHEDLADLFGVSYYHQGDTYRYLIARLKGRVRSVYGVKLQSIHGEGYSLPEVLGQMDAARERKRRLFRQQRDAHKDVSCIHAEDLVTDHMARLKAAIEDQFDQAERAMRDEARRLSILFRTRDSMPRAGRETEASHADDLACARPDRR